MTKISKTTIRTLLAAGALAAVALTFTIQPRHRAMASGPNGTGGINGASLDGLDKGTSCPAATEARAAEATAPEGMLLASGGTGGINGRSLDGLADELDVVGAAFSTAKTQ
jgi:hypothetical protein